MNGFAQAVIAKRNRERRDAKVNNAPKGFDILLADAILQFDMKQSDIARLNELTRNRQIAHAVVGYGVYYRRSTLESMFGNA